MNKALYIIALSSLALVSACAETKLVVKTAKIASQENEGKAYPYKVGKPYQVKGVWYYPKVDYSYDETGIASWYGPDFHGKKTASGETYDQNALTAAHKTLPMPSLVQVTNLENGRSIEVRINDRGPFSNNRLIDLSRRSAQLLDVEKKGTARVRVQILENESRAYADAAGNNEVGVAQQPSPDAAPAGVVVAQSLPPPVVQKPISTPASTPTTVSAPVTTPEVTIAAAPGAGGVNVASTSAQIVVPQPSGIVSQGEPHATNLFIQAGAFVQRVNALSLATRLGDLGGSTLREAWVDKQKFYRVWIGPIATIDDADHLLKEVVARGIPNAKIVVE